MKTVIVNSHPLMPVLSLALTEAVAGSRVKLVKPRQTAVAELACAGHYVLGAAEVDWLGSVDPALASRALGHCRRLERAAVIRGGARVEFAFPPVAVVKADAFDEVTLAAARTAGTVTPDVDESADDGSTFTVSTTAPSPFGCSAWLPVDTAAYVYLFDPKTGRQARAFGCPDGGTVLAVLGAGADRHDLARFAAMIGADAPSAVIQHSAGAARPEQPAAAGSGCAMIAIDPMTCIGEAPSLLGTGLPAFKVLIEASSAPEMDGEAMSAALQSAVRAQHHPRANTRDWFENWTRYAQAAPRQFAFSLTTASQRRSFGEVSAQDPEFAASVADTLGAPGRPPAFSPFEIAGLTIPNRIVVSPMCMYSARDGIAGDFHLVHLGARALGGAGLVMTEMTAVSEAARITPGCAGIYSDAHRDAWARVVQFVRENSSARIGLQLGHAGPKGSTRLGWEGMDQPLTDGNWPIFSASALPYAEGSQTPAPLDETKMDRIVDDYVEAAVRAGEAGFELLEIHAAHGYLLSSFLSPVTNRRDDHHGGVLENRLRFPLKVLGAVRAVWKRPRPLTVRISAVDWVEGGTTLDDGVAIARAFRKAGADAISVSSGQVSPKSRPVYGQAYQVPLSDRIRNEAGCPTIAVGAITTVDQVSTIVAAGRADLCALARPHLADAAWTLHAAIESGVRDVQWPRQYLAGKAQMERELKARSGGAG